MKIIDVVAGIIRRASGDYCLARRPDHLHQGGRWEFPGGKIETGETAHQALARELREEIGIRISHSIPFMSLVYAYPEKTVRLFFREVSAFDGDPVGLEGQQVSWFGTKQLADLAFPAANQPVVRALQLGDFWLVTPAVETPQSWLKSLQRSLNQQSLGAVYLREVADLSLLKDAVQLCREYRVPSLVSGDEQRVQASGADGWHLKSHQLLALQQRPSVNWLSAACHDAQQLACAAHWQLDAALVSPVLPTASHPHQTPLGWDGLAALTATQPLAIYALGGVSAAQLLQAREAGARGVAGISAFWAHTDG